MRRVKIVCTLGPASNTLESVTALVHAGMDVARLNFSHGTHDFHQRLLNLVRKASQGAGRPIAIMQDLQGPKIRVGALPPEGILLQAGQTILLYPEGSSPKSPTKGRIAIPLGKDIAEPISRGLKKDAAILFDDGKIQCRVLSVAVPEIVAEVQVGGKLTSHKGMNLPGSPLPIPSVTKKDWEDLKFGLEMGVDMVALSFVRKPADIEEVKNYIQKHSPQRRPLVIAKIEREEAVDAMEAIVDVSDGILVARGDMAVELGADRVPVIQKQLIHACNQVGVPVITATQMLESMIQSPTPTRAEASDVANAVFDGTDAVMLSAETASGQYPVEAVKTMAKIIVEAERNHRFSTHKEIFPMPGSIVDSVEFSASRVAHHTGAVAIACLTHTGKAARTLAKFRPSTPIVAIMDNEEALRKLAPVWGVSGLLIPHIVSTDDVFLMVEEALLEKKWCQKDDYVVVTAGVPTLRRGTTNMIKVHRVGAAAEREFPTAKKKKRPVRRT